MASALSNMAAQIWHALRQGLCNKGEDCLFLHTHPPVENKIACKFLIAGMCMQGDACRYSHDLSQVLAVSVSVSVPVSMCVSVCVTHACMLLVRVHYSIRTVHYMR